MNTTGAYIQTQISFFINQFTFFSLYTNNFLQYLKQAIKQSTLFLSLKINSKKKSSFIYCLLTLLLVLKLGFYIQPYMLKIIFTNFTFIKSLNQPTNQKYLYLSQSISNNSVIQSIHFFFSIH